MPYVMNRNGDQWCVYKKGTSKPVKGGCHPTREKALAHMRALYANVPDARNMMNESILVSLNKAFAEDGNVIWLEALPAKTWHTIDYGEVPITVDKLQRMVANFKSNVRGQEIATNFDHGTDRAKGNKASGWFRDFKVAPSLADPNVVSLHAAVELTDEAAKEIKDRQWRYFSMEWEDFWQHPETQDVHQDVIVGGGFTNRPIAKGMVPINFSEVWDEVQMANTAPYGNVTYADPGYRKDKKKRYPLDKEERIRAAWSYINMPKNAKFYTSSQLSSIKAKIKAAMKRIGAAVKSMSEAELEQYMLMSEAELMDVPESDLEGPVDEVPELAHSEPGTNVEPAYDEVGETGGASDSGSRLDTPPAGEDGTVPSRSDTVTGPHDEGGDETVLDTQIREVLGLSPDADIIKAVSDMKATVEPLEAVAKEMSERKEFAELYPEQAAELDKLRKAERDREAKAFAEKFGTLRFKDSEENETNKGYSGLALQKIEAAHKKFSEGAVTLEDFEDILNTIAAANGVVEFGEVGSSGEDTMMITESNPRIAFAEAVKRKMSSDETLSYEDAIRAVTKDNPQLAEAYAKFKPAA